MRAGARSRAAGSTRRALALGLAAAGLAGAAAAQRLPSHGRSVAATDDSTALHQNPANLAYLPAPEFRWSSVYLSEAAHAPWQGHALALGLPFTVVGLGTGLRVDLVSPPALATSALGPGGTLLGDLEAYQVLTWGLALGGEGSALGLSAQRYFSADPRLHGLSTWTAALSVRPWNALALSVVAHDFDGDSTAAGGRVGPSTTLAAALRPTGDTALEVGLEARYLADAETWQPRSTLAVALPFGRVRAEGELTDPGERPLAWKATLGVELDSNNPFGSNQVGVTSLLGRSVGPAPRPAQNVGLDVAVRGHREATVLEAPRLAVRVRVENTPNNRQHEALLRALWRVAEREPAVDAVVLELRTSPGESWAHVEELRDALHHLRQRGKRVLCHLEDSGGLDLYLCAGADRILINPAGGLRFAGLRTQYTYLGALLGSIGVRAQVVRIGDHKSAPEQFTRDGASPTARADKIDLLQQYELEFVTAVARGRGLSVEALREKLARGPFIAAEALKEGLVDGYAFDDQVEEKVGELVGRELMLMDLTDLAWRAPSDFGRGRRIAVVHLEGNLIDGRSSVMPLVGTRLLGSYTIAETLRDVRNDPSVAAVVLRVDSGGGSAMASDVIWREVQLTAEKKPVIASMAGAAASGGYYLAAPATRILASPLTITGSIGIFYGKADLSGLLRKLGVTVETYRSAPRADAESPYRPYTAEEQRELERKVKQFYDMFLARVAEGRHTTPAAIDAVGQGRVWTGRQALARGLVDELGGLRQALAAARAAANLPEDSPTIDLPVPETSLLGLLLGIEGVSEAPPVLLPPGVLDLCQALAPFVVYRGDQPLALFEWARVE